MLLVIVFARDSLYIVPASCSVSLCLLRREPVVPSPKLSLDEFCKVARQVVDELPEPFHAWMQNVVIDVEDEPSAELLEDLGFDPEEETLFGLFEGAAITELGFEEHSLNRIRLFQRPLEEYSRSVDELVYEIRRTVIHELAHHFGYSETDLDEFEAQASPFDDDADDADD